MSNKPEVQSYRASVAAIIINDQKQFFLVQQEGFKEDEWDFVKGGMHKGESEEDTIRREITEELGSQVKYKILRRSTWNVIYEWPEDLQLQKGFRGQARISFWIKYESGQLIPNRDELKNDKWFDEKDISSVLTQSGVRPTEVRIFANDWEDLKKEFPDVFVN